MGAFAWWSPYDDEIEKFMSRVGIEYCNVLRLPPAESRPDMNEEADRIAANNREMTGVGLREVG